MADDERYVLTVMADKSVRLRDLRESGTRVFGNDQGRALYDALGVLANWRERDADGRPHVRDKTARASLEELYPDGGWPEGIEGDERTDNAPKSHYVADDK